MRVPQNLLEEIFRQAESAYPEECCGFIVGKDKTSLRRISVKNVQQQYHEKDPAAFPRTARSAYFMDPKELLLIQKELRGKSENVFLIYHSHPDAEAYFSSEDQKMAAAEGEPSYPGVLYGVVSVIKGKASDWKVYRWQKKTKKFGLI